MKTNHLICYLSFGYIDFSLKNIIITTTVLLSKSLIITIYKNNNLYTFSKQQYIIKFYFRIINPKKEIIFIK